MTLCSLSHEEKQTKTDVRCYTDEQGFCMLYFFSARSWHLRRARTIVTHSRLQLLSSALTPICKSSSTTSRGEGGSALRASWKPMTGGMRLS